MSKREPWSEYEDKVLSDCMKKYGIEGRKIASKKLKRTINACTNRSYVLNKTENLTWDKFNKVNSSSIKVLKEEIQKSPNNLRNAFRETSKKTGLTYGSIQTLYYSKGSPMYKDNLGVCFCLISSTKAVKNKKNFNTSKKERKTSTTLWNKIKSLFL